MGVETSTVDRIDPVLEQSFFDLSVDVPRELATESGFNRFLRALRTDGMETFELGEAGKGRGLAQRTLRINGGTGAGFKAFGVAKEHGLAVVQMRLTYPVEEGLLAGPWWEMVFSSKDTHERKR